MEAQRIGGAASSLLSPLLDGEGVGLREVARTWGSVHYATATDTMPVFCVCDPSAVRLPNALVAESLPGAGRATIGRGLLVAPGGAWSVTRWWLPPRPSGLRPPRGSPVGPFPTEPELRLLAVPRISRSYDGLRPATLIGAGPGLTPAGDDLVAGALVAAHATADPRLPRWQGAVRELLDTGRTTAVSVGLLHCALEGYATQELSDFVHAVCDQETESGPSDLARATATLLAVGHSSGAALMTGVLHTFSTTRMRGAA